MAISFDTNHSPIAGRAEQIEDDLVVITANNASPMTFTGTRSYILGTKNLIVIDPGPDNDHHFNAIMKYIGKRKVTDILLTHSHIDHSPLSRQLKIETGARKCVPGGWYLVKLPPVSGAAGANIYILEIKARQRRAQ